MYFFRNPKRIVPIDDNLLISPSDGTVVSVSLESPCEDLGVGTAERYMVCIFLSIFDVHVNRIPISGTIAKVLYRPGSFVNASLSKASALNERNTLVISLSGQENSVVLTQVAGMIARRIVCDVHEGEEVKKGSVFGMIRFGSRVEVWLPVGVTPLIVQGQKMIAGETVLADLSKTDSKLVEGIEV
jgi:phosphatidylserine decarboxylase